MNFTTVVNDIENRKTKLNLVIQTMYEDIVNIIHNEIENNRDKWSELAIELMAGIIGCYKQDPWNFVKNELDPLIDGTTLDNRKLKIFDIDSIKNIKNSILNFTEY